MSNEQLATIAKIFSLRAEIAGMNISPAAIATMAEDLSDLNFNDVMPVLKSWGKTNRGFPYPNEVREMILPTIDGDGYAVEVASRIIAAISPCGRYNSQGARERIGELGWEVVQHFGGWTHICENSDNEQLNTMRAQLRGLAEVVYKKSQRGELDQLPELPTATNIASIVSSTLKRIE